MKVWQICAGSAALLILFASLAFFTRHEVINFDRLQEAKNKLAALGLYVTPDCADGKLSCGFLLSKNASSWSEVCLMKKSGLMGPEWRGKVWVTLNPHDWQLESIPERAGVRVWGSVVAFGDDELLREIEAGL